jgi:hypothetical protein
MQSRRVKWTPWLRFLQVSISFFLKNVIDAKMCFDLITEIENCQEIVWEFFDVGKSLVNHESETMKGA